MYRLIICSFTAVLLLTNALPVFAQATSTIPGASTTTAAPSRWLCANNNVVTANLQSEITSTVPGALMTFSATLNNTSDQFLSKGAVQVKIYKRADRNSKDGDYLVDRFNLKSTLVLPPKDTQNVSFEWRVPNNAEDGQYFATYLVTTADGYIVGDGMLTGDGAPFLVVDVTEKNGVTKFNLGATTINDTDINIGGEPVTINADSVRIKTSLTNPSDSVKTIPLQWNQYAFNSANEKNKRFTKTEVITLAPNETKELTYDGQPQSEAGVVVTATTQDGESKSILSLEYIQAGASDAYIQLPHVTGFPLVAGVEQSLSACVYAVGESEEGDSRLTISVSDKEGNMIHQFSKDNVTAEGEAGFGELFTPNKNYDYVVVTATLQRNGVVAEKVTIVYDCAAIDPTHCLSEEKTTNSLIDFITKNLMNILLTTSVVVLLIALMVYYRKHRKYNIVAGPLLFFMLFVAGFIFDPSSAMAQYCGPTGYEAYSNAEFNAYSTQCQTDGFTNLEENISEPDGGDLGNLGKTYGCLVTQDTGVGWRYKWFTNPDAACGGGPASSSCTWTRFLQDEFDGWVGQVYPRCQNRFAYFASIKPLCTNIGVIEGAAATGSEGSCLPYTSGNDACGTNSNITYYSFDQLIPDGPGCAVSNVAPNTPTISGPNSGNPTINYTFSLTATDNDGDMLRYGVDWDNNGSIDEWLPGTGLVNSGTQQSGNRSWASNGTYTFQALAQDSNGANSGWAAHTITISTLAAATADLKINNSDGPVSVPKNTSVNLTWTSANAASCTKWGGAWGSGEGIALSGSDTTVVAASGTYMINCGGVIDSVNVVVVNQTPNPPTITYTSGTLQTNQNITFAIQGSDPDNDNVFYEIDWDNNGSVDATTMTVPSNTSQPATRSWSSTGTVTFQARTVDAPPGGLRSAWTRHSETISAGPPPPPPPSSSKPNFNQPNISYTPSAGFDPVTGIYNSVLVTFQTTNNGLSNTIANANYQFQFDRGANGYEVTTTGSVGLLNVGQTFNQSETVAFVPFGNTRIRVTIDDYPALGAVDESDETDNYRELSFNLPPPNPGLSITADRLLVRSGETVTLNWDTGAAYPMSCTITGPGIVPAITFDPSINGTTGTRVSAPINAKSVFTISCVVGGTTFTDSVTIETQGVIEEI